MSDSLPMRTKLAFGVGAMGEASTNWIFNALTFFYYNQILGLSGTLTGAAVFIGICFDAVSDPVVGSLSDRTRSRLGRRHPWMFAAPLPVIASIFFIYHPPDGLSEWTLFAWFMCFLIMMRLSITLFAVPHLALGAELSDDYLERSKVMSYNNIFTYAGVVTMHVVVWFLIFPSYENGRMQQEAYLPMIMFGCALIVVAIMASTVATRDRIPLLNPAPEGLPAFKVRHLFLDIWATLQNRNYRYLLLGLFFLSVMIGTHETLGIYMGTFYWELTDQQIGWLIMNNVFGYVIGFVMAVRLHSSIDKRWTIVASAVGLSIFWSSAVTLRLFDLAPENTSWELVIFIIGFGTLASACGSIINISVMSALADIADEHELATGRRQEGIFYSARTFFAKASNGAGHVVAGIALDLIDFPAQATVETLTEDQIFALGLIDGPFAMIWGLMAAVLYAGYRIDKRHHADVQARLVELRERSAR